MLFKSLPAAMVLIATAGCNQNPPQATPKGLLVTTDRSQIIVVGDNFTCQGATKVHPGEDGLKDAVTGWVECSPKDAPSGPAGPPDGA
ncbi:hypothetical protein RT95_07345 [Xanthomonas campestris]|nr:hypothetical protein RT95_07345 [Xanthomonas campestris]